MIIEISICKKHVATIFIQSAEIYFGTGMHDASPRAPDDKSILIVLCLHGSIHTFFVI